MSRIHGQAAGGLLWTTLSFLGRRGVGLGTKILLARLLFPEEFGLVAMVAIFTAFLKQFRGMGLGAALVQREALEERHKNAAFWFAFLVGLFLMIVVFVTAPLMARAFDEPRLVLLARVLSFQFLITSSNVVHGALLRRELQFKTLAKREITATTASAFVAAAVALWGGGAWALVAQTLTQCSVSVVLLWRLSGWRPDGSFAFGALREIFGFSAYVTGTSLLTFVRNQSDKILIATFLTASALGIYGLAFTMVRDIRSGVQGIFQRVLFPIYSRTHGPVQELAKAHVQIVGAATAVLYLPWSLTIALAPELLDVMVGPRWGAAAEPLAWLALAAVFGVPGFFNDPLFKSRGRADLPFKLRVILVPIEVGGLVFALQYGIVGLAAAKAAITLLNTAIGIIISMRLVESSGWVMLRSQARFLLPAAAAWFAASQAKGLTDASWSALLLSGLAGTAAYALAMSFTARHTPARIVALGRRAITP